MNRKLYLLIVSFVLSASLFAQVSVDPQNEFYTQLQRWENLGLVEKQPPLRPYPVQKIQEILNTVSEGPNAVEAEKAVELYEEYFSRKIPVKPTLELKQNLVVQGAPLYQMLAVPSLQGDFALVDKLSVSYNFGGVSGNHTDQWMEPYLTDTPYSFQDQSDFVAGFKNSVEADISLAFSFKNFYVQAGINHSDFGSFYEDSIVLNPNANHTANFSLVYSGDRICFTESLFVLTATNGIDRNKILPNKFLMLQSLNVKVTDWLSAGYYQSAIYGKRFEPAYFVPMFYIVTEGVTGYDGDNILMGVNFEVKPLEGLVWKTDFYMDDIGFTGLKKYHTIRLHNAFQTGVEYVPASLDWFKIAQFNYTMVSPYMYTHAQLETNASSGGKVDPLSATLYQTYTTGGQNLGSNLLPNSDRFALTMTFEPVENLQLDFGVNLIRHANVVEGLSLEEQLKYMNSTEGYYSTDGGIYTHFSHDGYSSTYLPSAWNKTMFLTQQTKEITFQTSANALYTFPKTSAGTFSLGLGYTFEHIKNYGVASDIFPGKPEGSSVTYTEADVLEALEDWRNSLKDVTRNYLSVYFKYQF